MFLPASLFAAHLSADGVMSLDGTVVGRARDWPAGDGETGEGERVLGVGWFDGDLGRTEVLLDLCLIVGMGILPILHGAVA
ncbi:hypothetical protein Ct61P_00786 [Colletotrichum tofieldiae]|nr:hypothetical protein Ct61P_00786 [Colletotrichum tofieldiae]